MAQATATTPRKRRGRSGQGAPQKTLNAHCRTCTERPNCETPAKGAGTAADPVPWCHKGTPAEPVKQLRGANPLTVIPPAARWTVTGHSRACSRCVRFTRRGGACPGVVGSDPRGPACLEEADSPQRHREPRAENGL